MFYKDGKLTVTTDEALRRCKATRLPFYWFFIATMKAITGESAPIEKEDDQIYFIERVAEVFMAAGYIQGVRDERTRRRT